jgi:hypothetical protein
MFPNEWGQRSVIAKCKLAQSMRLCQHFLDHQRVDIDHAVLNQVQRRVT